MRPSALALGKGDSASQSLPRVCRRNAHAKHVDVAAPRFKVSFATLTGVRSSEFVRCAPLKLAVCRDRCDYARCRFAGRAELGTGYRLPNEPGATLRLPRL